MITESVLRCRFCGGDLFELDHDIRCDGRQGGLEPDFVSPDPSHNVRRTDPDTSHEAAYANLVGRKTIAAKVYAMLESMLPDGLTDVELSIRLPQYQLNSLNKRRGELRDQGLVMDSGRRRLTPAEARAIVWVAVKR